MQNTYTLKINLEFLENEFSSIKYHPKILRHLGETDIQLDEIFNLKKYIDKNISWNSRYSAFPGEIYNQIQNINQYLLSNNIITENIIDGREYYNNKYRFYAIFIKNGFLDFVDMEYDYKLENQSDNSDDYDNSDCYEDDYSDNNDKY